MATPMRTTLATVKTILRANKPPPCLGRQIQSYIWAKVWTLANLVGGVWNSKDKVWITYLYWLFSRSTNISNPLLLPTHVPIGILCYWKQDSKTALTHCNPVTKKCISHCLLGTNFVLLLSRTFSMASIFTIHLIIFKSEKGLYDYIFFAEIQYS
jgi:hypothetical protein